MTAGTTQPKKSAQRRIIERPRLMALLTETEARLILLLAPAGYGKTTLARQWVKTLQGALCLTLSPAHRDISVLANDLARCLGEPAETYVHTYVQARSNPQRDARDIARTVAAQVEAARTQWLVVDDYHEVVVAPEAEAFFEALHRNTNCRILIASRLRPSWTDARLTVYGELAELGRDSLALSSEESREVLGDQRGTDELLARAAGWPAAIGLAAATGITTLRGPSLSSTLHAYLTDELYRSAPEPLRKQLLRLALASDLEDVTLRRLFGGEWQRVISQATDLGFLNDSEKRPELHPLIRDYLLDRIAAEEQSEAFVSAAIDAAAQRERWDRAFELIVRFNEWGMAGSVLELAYAPLLRTGQLGTLAAFVMAVRTTSVVQPPVIDLAEGELALRDGAFELAGRIANRAAARFPVQHPLISRAHAIVGQSAFVQADLVTAESAYRKAFETARSEEDEAEALRGWALASIQGEVGDGRLALEGLAERSARSPMDLLRYATVSLVSRRFRGGLSARPPEIDEGASAARHVRDPRAQSSYAYSATYALGLRAEYAEATAMMDMADEIISEFDLDFARPYANWNRAWIAIGLRRFGHAERALQSIEDAMAKRPLAFHLINCRILRARLAMQTGREQDALRYLPLTEPGDVIPSIYGEYLATRALALAILGDTDASRTAAAEAITITTAAEVRALAAAAQVAGNPNAADGQALWTLCESLGTWDPLLAALRASPQLAESLASCEEIRQQLAQLYERSNDMGLARRAGLRVRSPRSPEDLLTPREMEVLGMLAQGLRNVDIAKALVVSDSTVKVHVRHIFEKLGVRTRTEAVARADLMP